jgi:two-component system, NarL family, sensor histidine kinase YdfH
MKRINLFKPFRIEHPNELPFFILVTVILAGIASWAVYTTPGLQIPNRYIPFAVLMIIHIGLYWVSFLLKDEFSIILAYLVLQGMLAFLLNLIGQSIGLSIGLYMGLIGIAVGLLQLTRRTALVVGFYLILSLINFGWLSGWREIIWWLAAVLPIMIFIVIYVTLYNRQAEARARAQALAVELETANRQLSDYAARVEALTLTNERQRMARELHDTLSQGLAGLILQLEAADAHLANNHVDRARTIVQQVMGQARATLSDARRAIDDLRLKAPGDLAEQAQQEAGRFSEATGIPCPVEIQLLSPVPDLLREPARCAIAEALSNIARHAQARQVQVRLASADGWLEITVRDDGIGFDPQAAAALPGHYGLLGMRERARLVGGTLEIDSRPGAGTTILVRLPIREDAAPNSGAGEAE